jgi:hypothetical protein
MGWVVLEPHWSGSEAGIVDSGSNKSPSFGKKKGEYIVDFLIFCSI